MSIETKPGFSDLLTEEEKRRRKEKFELISQLHSKRDSFPLLYPKLKRDIFLNNFKEEKENILNFKKEDKNILYPIFKIDRVPKPVYLNYNPSITSFNFSPKAGLILDAQTQITAENIAEFAYPLAQFIEQAKPDYIMACDRGARIIALAVHRLYQELYGALPTQNHAISFRKISRRVPEDVVKANLRPDVQTMLATVDYPTVLVLDDWVATGGTKKLVEDVFNELSGGRINVLYGVMRGKDADVTGKKDCRALGDWHDRPELIGVDYENGSTEPHKITSPFPSVYRETTYANIKKFARSLNPKVAPPLK